MLRDQLVDLADALVDEVHDLLPLKGLRGLLCGAVQEGPLGLRVRHANDIGRGAVCCCLDWGSVIHTAGRRHAGLPGWKRQSLPAACTTVRDRGRQATANVGVRACGIGVGPRYRHDPRLQARVARQGCGNERRLALRLHCMGPGRRARHRPSRRRDIRQGRQWRLALSDGRTLHAMMKPRTLHLHMKPCRRLRGDDTGRDHVHARRSRGGAARRHWQHACRLW
mmetsp:Transcript_115954/g.368783  ORF Transcript_115954/g.368783 Transcript_115954/m.368783 type:complete len:224 (+) Transcript_115954:2088-2759(+)